MFVTVKLVPCIPEHRSCCKDTTSLASVEQSSDEWIHQWLPSSEGSWPSNSHIKVLSLVIRYSGDSTGLNRGSTRRTLRPGSEREKTFAGLELLTVTVTVLWPGYNCHFYSDCTVVSIQLSLLQW